MRSHALVALCSALSLASRVAAEPVGGPESSNLNHEDYGWDFVVAATEFGINDAVKRFLAQANTDETPVIELLQFQKAYIPLEGLPPPPSDVVNVFMTVDEWEDKVVAAGKQPFDIWNDIANNSYTITEPRLSAATFTEFEGDFLAVLTLQFGFRARMGIPGRAEAEENGTLQEHLDAMDDILRLNAIDDIVLHLACEEFQIVTLTDLGAISLFKKWVQDPLEPWLVAMTVDLKFENAHWDNLTDEVKDQMMTVSGDAFSIEQLLFDTTRSELIRTTGVPDGVPAKIVTLLTNTFIPVYFDEFLKDGGPVLGYAGKLQDQDTPYDGTLKLNDYRLSVNKYKDPVTGLADPAHRRFNTLDYLCMSEVDKPIPSSEQSRIFDWNWVNVSDNALQGVIATNRMQMAKLIHSSLWDHIQSRAYRPIIQDDFADQSSSFYSVDFSELGTPTHVFPPTGDVLIQYTHSSVRKFEPTDWKEFKLTYNYNTAVTLSGSTITVDQHVKLDGRYKSVNKDHTVKHINRNMVDRFTLTIQPTGELSSRYASDPVQVHTETELDLGWWEELWHNLELISDSIDDMVDEVVDRDFADARPERLSGGLGAFVLPAARTFRYQDVWFSDQGDLLTTWSYT